MLGGDCDWANAPDFEARLFEAFDGEPTEVVVDLRGVSFLDSSVLRVLLRGLSHAKLRETRFALVRPSAPVWRVFVLAGLSDCFTTYSSLGEALAPA